MKIKWFFIIYFNYFYFLVVSKNNYINIKMIENNLLYIMIIFKKYLETSGLSWEYSKL